MKDNYRITRTIETYLDDDGRLIQRDRDFYGKTKEEAEFKYRQYLKATSEEEKPHHEERTFYGKTKEEAEAKYRRHLQASVEEEKLHQAAKEFFGKTKEEALYEYLKASSESAGKYVSCLYITYKL